MAAHRKKGGKRRGGDHGGHADERWLLTYADMITLLMALFIVMFSISSVNKGKYEELTKSLEDAFSGQILSGGTSFMEKGNTASDGPPTTTPPIPAIREITGKEPQLSPAAKREEEDFAKVKQEIDEIVEAGGLGKEIETTVARRGLVIRLLTDGVLFDSGEARLKPRAEPLLNRLAGVLRMEVRHPITVEGHTDRVPIRSAQFPTNWELSSNRASSVVRYLIRRKVSPRRLAATGYAALHPLATNATEPGRTANRRVEIVLNRLNKAPQGGGER